MASFPGLAALARQHELTVFRTPARWATWPFLPVSRPAPEGSGRQLGVLYDARGVSGLYGHSATVFLCNLFLLPRTEPALLRAPRCVYDSAEELADAGWTLD